jgi:hypothetical protein
MADKKRTMLFRLALSKKSRTLEQLGKKKWP